MINFPKIGQKKLTFIRVSVIIFISICAFVIFFSILDKSNSRTMAEKYLTSVTEGVTKTVDSWIEEKKKSLTLISDMPEIKEVLNDQSLNMNNRLEIIIRNYTNLENIFIASADAKIISGSLYSNSQYENLSNLMLWDRFKKNNFQIYLDTYISRSQSTGKLTFIIIKGVFSEEEELLGFIGFTINWEKFIKKFIIPANVGETGYLAITDTSGRNIGHHDSSLTLQSMYEYPWMKKLINEKNGFQRYRFREENKLMAFHQSIQTGWIINASINENELIKETNRIRNFILLISIIIFLILIFIIGYLDMFKLEAAERNLIESERNFKLLLERGNDGIFVHKIEKNGEPGSFTKTNGVFLELFQCRNKEVLNCTPENIFNTNENHDYLEVLKTIIKTKLQILETELIINNKKIQVEFRLFLIETNKDYQVMGFVRDITERVLSRRKLKEDRDYLNNKVAERTKEILKTNIQLRTYIKEKDKIAQALSESEDKYRRLIERANDGIMLIRDKKICFANKKIKTLLNYNEEELSNIPFEKIICTRDREIVIENHVKRLKGEITRNIFETRLISSEGHDIDVEINAGLINYRGVTEDFIFVRDITERKKNEEEKRRQNEQLVQTDKLVALGTLVSGVAHEINNPNNAIMLNNPIIKEAWESSKPILENYKNEHGDFLISGMPYSYFKNYFPDIIDGIHESSEKIKHIVEDLKNFAKPDAGAISEDVDLNKVIQSSVKLISSQLNKATDNFELDLIDNLPSIKGNFRRLEQIFINLLQNAYNALESREKGISVISSFEERNMNVKILIIDQGCGISQENIKQIFDPFFTTKRDRGGTGLGLSVSLGLIKEHHGIINFESKEGEGTVVTLKFPVINT
jgi:PAS domain S-box-containing protein